MELRSGPIPRHGSADHSRKEMAGASYERCVISEGKRTQSPTPEGAPTPASFSMDMMTDEPTVKKSRTSLDLDLGSRQSSSKSETKSAGDIEDEKMGEDRAEKIRASRGNYEVEVTCTGENGLHQSLCMCRKNQGHQKFIPTYDFSIEHLPSRYRDDLLVDLVRAQSNLTCRLSVSRISKHRPKTWPDSEQPFPFSSCKGDSFMFTGTGWVNRVIKYTENDKIHCNCEECTQRAHTPKTTWGIVWIQTSCHLVYDSEEARHTKCQFFYDSHKKDISQVPTLTGGKVVRSDFKGDWCEMTYITHNMKLLDELANNYRRWRDLRDKVLHKDNYLCNTSADHDLCIIVSHPHGHYKTVSVGKLNKRQLVRNDGSGNKEFVYSYDTPTCPGSAGAAIFTLVEDIESQDGLFHPQAGTQNRVGNNNNTAVIFKDTVCALT